jgi:serpin B
MKTKKVLMVLGLAFVLLASFGCKSHNPAAITPIQPPQQAQSSTIQEPPSDGDNDFTFDVYHQVNTSSGNVFFSPFSLYDALAMTYEGAKGQTAYQMAKVLYLQQDNATRWQSFASLIGEINSPGKHYTLNTANNLWLEKIYTFSPGFLNTVETYYSATATAMDFIYNPGSCLQTINNAVANETAGNITNLLPPGSITSATALVLTNAIYFNATWAIPFDANATTYNAFTTSTGTVEQVSTMHYTIPSNVENYYGVAQAMELPYVNNEVSMFVFLPPAGSSAMASLDSCMTGAKMNAWLAARPATVTSTAQVVVSLPKFTIHATYNDMATTLSNMGMILPFTPAADFSGMSSIVNGNTSFYISGVFHQAQVEVAEKGTEASAATAVVVTVIAGCVSILPPVQYEYFTVNSPFIFMIRENTSNTILFIGKVNDPNAG